MHWLDWTLVALSLLVVLAMAAYARRFVQGVADFMSGGRSAGRYLLTVWMTCLLPRNPARLIRQSRSARAFPTDFQDAA